MRYAFFQNQKKKKIYGFCDDCFDEFYLCSIDFESCKQQMEALFGVGCKH